MSICVLAGTPGGPSVQVQGLLAAAQAFGGFVAGFAKLAADVVQGAAGQVPADSIVLLNTNILDWTRRNETSGPNYTWTRHTIRLRAIYNPLLNSFVQANAQQAPAFRIGFKAPVTDTAIRHALAQPRRKFMLFVGNTLVLESPRGQVTVDAQLGPFVKVNRVSLVSGTKTFLVDLTIETCVNESYLFTNKPSVMLAHTYSSQHAVDQDFYTTRVIHGHATFDTGRLVALGARADDFRAYLFHGISPGFHRVSIDAQVDEGGGELAYTIVDREVTHSLGEYARIRNVTRIQCTHDSANMMPGVWDTTIGAVNKALDGKTAGPGAIFSAAAGLVPIGVQTVVVKVWGNNRSTRAQLREVAAIVIGYRTAQLPNASRGIHASWHDDVKGRFVQGTYRTSHAAFENIIDSPALEWLSPVGAIFRDIFLTKKEEPIRGMPLPPGANTDLLQDAAAVAGGGVRPQRAVGRVMELGEDIAPGFDIWSSKPRSVVVPPADGPLADMSQTDTSARGTYVESLVSSALLAPNQAPPQPGSTPYAKHREPPDGTAAANVPVFP